MKALCVAVVLSFISAGQPAPLTCDLLLKPLEKGPELSGRWYYIAVSTELCLATLLDSFVSPSVAVDITSKDTPNLYDGITMVKMYGYCKNDSESFHYDLNKLYDVNSENAATGDPETLLYTGCHDCLVVKAKDIVDTFVFLSRRTVVTDTELKEFEKQAECLGWSKPLVLNTDHEYANCPNIDDVTSDKEAENLWKVVFAEMMERLKNSHHNIIKCFTDMIMYYINVPTA